MITKTEAASQTFLPVSLQGEPGEPGPKGVVGPLGPRGEPVRMKLYL